MGYQVYETETQSRRNTCVVDAESGAETARLVLQDRVLNASMDGVLPEEEDIENIGSVLDLGCGPGGWVLEMAFHYPDTQVTGVDISRMAVDYARALARVQWLENAHFRVMDITRSLEFDDEMFDVVNARLLACVLSREHWQPLIQESLRVVRPGGIIRLTECERSITTSAALEELQTLLCRALRQGGYGFAPDGQQLSITPVLGRLLRQAGCQQIEHRAHVVDYSVDTPLHRTMVENTVIGWQLVAPFLYRMEVTTPDRFLTLYRQMQLEMMLDEFSALWYFCTVKGYKP